MNPAENSPAEGVIGGLAPGESGEVQVDFVLDGAEAKARRTAPMPDLSTMRLDELEARRLEFIVKVHDEMAMVDVAGQRVAAAQEHLERIEEEIEYNTRAPLEAPPAE